MGSKHSIVLSGHRVLHAPTVPPARLLRLPEEGDGSVALLGAARVPTDESVPAQRAGPQRPEERQGPVRRGSRSSINAFFKVPP